MWGGAGWQSWPMQESAVQGAPSEEVDWAALAKQWIAQKESGTLPPDTQKQGSGDKAAPPMVVHHKPEPINQHFHAPPLGAFDPVRASIPERGVFVAAGGPNMNQNHHPPPPPPPHQQEGWGWEVPNWGMPPMWNMPPPPPPQGEDHKERHSIDYDHGFQNFDYNHKGEEMYQQGYDQGEYEQHWETRSPPRMQEERGGRRNEHHNHSPIHTHPTAVEETGIDAAKRRALPVWIREGLEKMEREKQRKIDKERKDEEELEARKQEELEKAQKRENGDKSNLDDGKEESLPVLSKSKFESEDEDDEGDSPSKEREMSDDEERRGTRSPTPPEEPVMSEEEKQALMVVKMKQMLTEILLEVTNQEIEGVAVDVFNKAKARVAKGILTPHILDAAFLMINSKQILGHANWAPWKIWV